MEKWSWRYELLKFFLGIGHRLFYRKIYVEGKENIPKNKAVIFAPNHQNALMDPLAIIFTTNKQPVFLARGDFFKNKWLIKIFTFLKILPVYRIRDGKELLQKNEEVFRKSVNVLKYHQSFCLFPEAIHNPQRNLRPLKKGIPRIAFQALEETYFLLDIIIIPVGIYYENKFNSRSNLHIRYGKGIEVNNFTALYKENSQKGMLALRDEMSKRIKPLIIDIPGKDYYQFYEEFRIVFGPNWMKLRGLSSGQGNLFKTNQFIIRKLREQQEKHIDKFNLLVDAFTQFKQALQKEKLPLRHLDFYKKSRLLNLISLILIVLGFPLFLYGFVFNILPYYFIKRFVGKVKDNQFYSSIKYGAGTFIYPVYYLLLLIISFIFILFYWSIAFVISLPLTAFFAYYYAKTYKQLWYKYKFTTLDKGTKNRLVESFKQLEELSSDLYKSGS